MQQRGPTQERDTISIWEMEVVPASLIRARFRGGNAQPATRGSEGCVFRGREHDGEEPVVGKIGVGEEQLRCVCEEGGGREGALIVGEDEEVWAGTAEAGGC